MLFAGPDPADPSRVLVKSIVQVGVGKYALEETRVRQTENGPTVHSQCLRLKGLDLNEEVTQ